MALLETTVGSLNYNVLSYLLKTGNVIQIGLGAEIGVLHGDTSDHLLQEIPSLTLLSIDPYIEYIEEGHDRSSNALSECERATKLRLSKYGDRSRMLKLTSLEAAKQIPDGSLDFVFIDAMHTYDAVKEDIKAWYPKVRAEGLITGHDYRWSGVQKAVDEFQKEVQLDGFVTTPSSDVWFFVKP